MAARAKKRQNKKIHAEIVAIEASENKIFLHILTMPCFRQYQNVFISNDRAFPADPFLSYLDPPSSLTTTPRSMVITRFFICWTISWLWVTTITVVPLSLISSKRPIIS